MSRKFTSGSSFSKQRRKILKLLGLGSAAAASNPLLSQIRVVEKKDVSKVLTAVTNKKYLTIKVLRAEDLMSLELRYYNFSLSGKTIQKKGSPAYLAVIFQPQSISEQAWNEEMQSDASGNTSAVLETPTIPGKLFIGGESRLVFSIPDNISSIPLDLNEMLAWEKYNLVVNQRAKPASGGRNVFRPVTTPKVTNMRNKISAAAINKKTLQVRGLTKDERYTVSTMLFPEENSRREAVTNVAGNMRMLAQEAVGPVGELETSIEVPNRLYLSPTRFAGWSHSKKLKADKGVFKEANKLFELWHTRLSTKTTEGLDETEMTNEQRILRALWADDAKVDYKEQVIEKNDNLLGVTSITNKDRHQIVHETSNFQIPKFVPQPIKAYKLFLTTLGAWLDSELQVERKKLETAGVLYGSGNALNLLKWRHIETLGREHYVEIVKAGNIIPFGHEAVLIKITERKPHPGTGTAANFQRKIVVITEPVKEYNYVDSAGKFLNFCFNRIEIVTTVSPLLDANKKRLANSLPDTPLPPIEPGLGDTPPAPGDEQFVIISAKKEVMFKVKGEDVDGNIVDFSIPLAFASTDVLGSANNVKALTDAYSNYNPVNKPVTNTSDLNGQKISLARKTTNGGDTAFVAHTITFSAKPYSNADEPQGFLPEIKEVEIIEPSYQRITGSVNKVPVTLVDDRNAGHVFAAFKYPNPVNFGGQTDKTGGIAAPNFSLTGLSKAAGAFGGTLEKFKNAEPAANDFFNVVGELPLPKLFGVFKLGDLLDFVTGDKSAFDLSKSLQNRVPKIPNLVTEETENEFITTYLIKPKLNDLDLGGFVGFKKQSGAEFVINTQVKAKKKEPTSPEFSTAAWIKNFKIGIVKVDSDYLIGIDFKEIKFAVDTTKKSDVSVQMGNPCIVFGGPLSFINEINKLIPSDGFSDPPYLDVSLTGIKCGYTLALPDLQLGAFSLSHMSLGAEVNLPFTGGPLTLGFRFCERQQPFTLAVSFLGGGGFFGLELDLNGIRQIEAALEFGASVSLNFGVASGGVSVMAGIYFKMTFEGDHNSTQLTGYVRINGSVSVLGLITASLELYLALTYLSDPGKAYGEASLKIKVEVLFFSTSVTVYTKKTFAGSGSDPNFQMCITEGDWTDYCAAFVA